jgi:hypothetical protein
MIPTAWNRRTLLRGGLGLCGVSALPLAAAPRQCSTARGMILVLLEGGMSHFETWDPKPEAPREIRGEFGTIATSIPEVRLGEHLPRIAAELHRGNLLRAVHCDARNDHSPGLHLLLTGHENVAAGVDLERQNFRHPSFGSILAYKLDAAAEGGAPRFVGLPRSTQLSGRVNYNGPSFLGAAYEAFETGPPPRNAQEPGAIPPGLILTSALTQERVRLRLNLAADLDALHPTLDPRGLQQRRNAHYGRAVDVLTGGRTQAAFDLQHESPATRAAYGDHATGQSLLLARRLIEAGVTYVVVEATFEGGWDTHQANFTQLRQRLLPPLDQGLAALLRDLDDRGELDDVLVLVAGEMGRTPLINRDAGRDHWTSAYSVFLAGGGLTRGQVLGSTTRDGSSPNRHPVTVHDLLATAYDRLGVDPQASVPHPEGRLIPILPEGQPIGELLG